MAAAAIATDALHAAAADEARFLLIRRLELGVIADHAPARHWQTRAAARLGALRARALHAATPGAAAADAVWFASRDEARMLLLLELAAGRHPVAWFWRLAVPEWEGQGLSAWLPALAAEARTEPRAELFMARALLPMTRLGAVDALLAALADGATPLSRTRAGPPPHFEDTAECSTRNPREAEWAASERLLARLPADVRAAVWDRLAREGISRLGRFHLARLALLNVAPEIGGHQALLDALTGDVLTMAEAGARSGPPDRGPAAHAVSTSGVGIAAPGAAREDSHPLETGRAAAVSPGMASAGAGDTAATVGTTPHHGPVPAPADLMSVGVWQEYASPLAGVFLLVGPLSRLGLPDWLVRHPNREYAGFPRVLLRHIATRHVVQGRPVPPDDPVLRLLDTGGSGPPAKVLVAWRVGLDRYLRRAAGRRLADVVRRPGWLSVTEDRVTIRYPLAAADLALRRRALDVDPGWVPWLGWVVRYQFSDEAAA